ncbi:hypothetical protein, partial [Neisseria meningitidis]|uniref:hypothetical protein n=1 Tax=Neisseria meningitidis TaxID=487 RepID=UPI0039C893FC
RCGDLSEMTEPPDWIPACAGMTNFRLLFFRFLFLVFCSRGNNGILSFRNLSEKQKSPPPSFPQKRESRNEKLQGFIRNNKPSPPSFPRRQESRILMRQEFIGKNRSLKT